VRVISGCEFSVSASWGEMHVLGYFLPLEDSRLQEFLRQRQRDRLQRGRDIVAKLQAIGLSLHIDDVLLEAGTGVIGRPHVARALVRLGHAANLNDAFDRYVGWSRPGYVAKRLPTFAEVAAMVHAVGGLVSAAHLKDRGTRTVLSGLKQQGLDAVETRHPSHDPDTRSRLTDLASELAILRTGGSDWHGDNATPSPYAALGSQAVPAEWLERLEAAKDGDRIHHSSAEQAWA
jgi:3',5'-nucleoside bisphosphate phosphatase